VFDIIARQEIKALDEDTTDSKVDYDETNLYVYTKKIDED